MTQLCRPCRLYQGQIPVLRWLKVCNMCTESSNDSLQYFRWLLTGFSVTHLSVSDMIFNLLWSHSPDLGLVSFEFKSQYIPTIMHMAHTVAPVNFNHILQGYFTGPGAIIWLPRCHWSNQKDMDKCISKTDNIPTTKKSKPKCEDIDVA